MPEMTSGRVTQVIAAATALAWLAVLLFGDAGVINHLAGFLPARAGGLVPIDGGVPVWLTPLSATLLHAGLLHLGFNLLMFVYCGRAVESVIGGGAMLVLYLVGAYAAAAAHWLVDPASTVPMIGASGAISAVIGAYAVFFSRSQVRAIGPFSPFVVRVVWLAAGWVFVQSLIGLAAIGAQVAIAAHIGGFIAGLALARPLLLWRYRDA
jgi:membrane associated rhomboid family serine protease